MAQAPADLPKRLPLVVEPGNRGASTSYDSRLVNAYVETKRDGDRATDYWIYERPGLLEDSQPPGAAATGRGIFNWRDDIYSIFGATLYKNGVAVSGTVDTTNGVYRFDACLGGTPKLQLGNGVKAYNYDSGGGLVEITDGDFPTAFVKGWCFLDGTTYVMTADAGIYGSDINTPEDWDPLNVIIAQIEPDRGRALSKQLVYLVAFKEWTTEVFYDAANSSGSPLGRVQGAKINWGCLSADSVQDVGGALIWIGQARKTSPEIIYMDNLKAEPISTKPIERLLEKADFSTVYSWTLLLEGHRFYVVTLKEENLTLAFDLDERMWSQWTDEDGNYLPIVSSCMDSDLQHLLQHESNGKIYLASSDYATDDGELITVDIITPNFDGQTRRRKFLSMLEVVSDQQAGSELLVRVNDQDYSPTAWSNWRKFDLSMKRPFITDCGTFVRRVHHFRHRKPVRMPRIQAMEMQVDLGTL